VLHSSAPARLRRAYNFTLVPESGSKRQIVSAAKTLKAQINVDTMMGQQIHCHYDNVGAKADHTRKRRR
jgi:hypothetical protein